MPGKIGHHPHYPYTLLARVFRSGVPLQVTLTANISIKIPREILMQPMAFYLY